MKLINKTDWDTKQLKAFIRAIGEKEYMEPKDFAQLRVTVRYRKRTHARPDKSRWITFVICQFTEETVSNMVKKVKMSKTEEQALEILDADVRRRSLKSTAAELAAVEFPKCASRCAFVELMGVGECVAICAHKFHTEDIAEGDYDDGE